ncbi:MAG: hypothetical protein GWO24_08115, partial [Akkermansiaceae bacterium]|nr:hypothetical protein [Akkermansiaceae bacterium]
GALKEHQVTVDEAEVADVSFPGFWELLSQLANPETELAEER